MGGVQALLAPPGCKARTSGHLGATAGNTGAEHCRHHSCMPSHATVDRRPRARGPRDAVVQASASKHQDQRGAEPTRRGALGAALQSHVQLGGSQASVLGPLGPCGLLPQVVHHPHQEPASRLALSAALLCGARGRQLACRCGGRSLYGWGVGMAGLTGLHLL